MSTRANSASLSTALIKDTGRKSAWLPRHVSRTIVPRIWASILLLLSLAGPTLAVQIQVVNPPQQCGITTLNIVDGTAPFELTALIYASGAHGARNEPFTGSSNPVSWLTDVASGTRIQFELKNERHILSQFFTVEASDDAYFFSKK